MALMNTFHKRKLAVRLPTSEGGELLYGISQRLSREQGSRNVLVV
jgi:hypothetical protein